MKRSRYYLLAITAVALVGGCFNTASHQATLDNQLRTRASFDFSCPAAQLKILPLNQEQYSGIATAQGVEGCDHKATYVWNTGSQAWVLNTSTGTPESAPTTATATAQPAAAQNGAPQ